MVVSLDSLEIELLALILEFVIETSPTTTKSVALVNKHFYATTTLVGHRSKTVQYYTGLRGEGGKCTDLKPWIETEEILRGVRFITVEDYYDSEMYNHEWRDGRQPKTEDRETLEQEKYGDLVELLCKLGNLKKLIWSSHDPIPVAVVEALHKHKSAELAIWNWSRWDNTVDHTDSSEVALAKCPALTSIRASIWNAGQGSHPDLREVAVTRIISSAPNLRRATIITGASGCVIYSISPEEYAEISEMSKLFYKHKQPNPALRSLTLDGYGLTESALRTWSEFVNLSNLTAMKCSRGAPDLSYFNYAPTVLSSVKHISLNLSHHGGVTKDAVEGYISSCAPLESLSLWSWMGVVSLSSILKTHGPTLTTLQLHERETTANYGEAPRKILTAEEVKQIAAACPKLKDFCFDLDRHTRGLELELDEDADVFKAVAEMGLNKLQIYYDLGLASLTRPYGSINQPLDALSQSDLDSDDSGDDNDGNSPYVGGRKKVRAGFRQRKKSIPVWPLIPTPNPQISAFARALWKTVFRDRKTGHRTLELKVGEWERKMGIGYPAHWVIQEQNIKTRWIVRPMERDDRQSECQIQQFGSGYGGDALDDGGD